MDMSIEGEINKFKKEKQKVNLADKSCVNLNGKWGLYTRGDAGRSEVWKEDLGIGFGNYANFYFLNRSNILFLDDKYYFQQRVLSKNSNELYELKKYLFIHRCLLL